MPRRGCSALHGVNLNLKKNKKQSGMPSTLDRLSEIAFNFVNYISQILNA